MKSSPDSVCMQQKKSAHAFCGRPMQISRQYLSNIFVVINHCLLLSVLHWSLFCHHLSESASISLAYIAEAARFWQIMQVSTVEAPDMHSHSCSHSCSHSPLFTVIITPPTCASCVVLCPLLMHPKVAAHITC